MTGQLKHGILFYRVVFSQPNKIKRINGEGGHILENQRYEYEMMLDFIKTLEGTPLMEIFRIMEEGIFSDAGLPEVKEGEVFVSETNPFQKAAQTLLSKLEEEYAKLEKTIYNITVIPKRSSANFEIFVQKLENLEELEVNVSRVWDFLWTNIEKCTKKSREDLIICTGFKIVLKINTEQEPISLNYRFEKAMRSLGFTMVHMEESGSNQKKRQKMN